MKKRILTLVLLLVAATFAAEANPVDLRTAREVAVKFMNANSEAPLRGAEDLQLVTTYNISRGDAAFYVFNTPNGFVIVSADDCATPILGYSNEGRFDVNNIPIQLQDYLQDFVEQIQYGIENHLEADEQTARQWELVRTVGRLTNNRYDEVVEPLLTTTWNQGCYYNSLCPEDFNGPCGHVYAGCVATALAQIMRYWSYPEHGTGSCTYVPSNYPEQSVDFWATTYDWDNMPNSLGASSSPEQINAVATLLWHCGVSVYMNYSPSGSSAYLYSNTLVDYFNYSDELSIEFRSYYSDASWKAKLKDCLSLGRPLFYCGSSVIMGGHAFVCDGYDNNDMFHFNLGWSGSHDGYYAISAVYGFNSNQEAAFNIHPQGETTNYVINVSSSNDEGGVVSGGGTFAHGTEATLTATSNNGYHFCYWEENGGIASTDPIYSFTVNYNRDLVAVFAEPFLITVSSTEGGVVSGGGSYAYGASCTVTAMPDEGYAFSYWLEDGNVVSCESEYSFTVTSERNLMAQFMMADGIISFDDANVKAICLANWDTNGDGGLSYDEAAAVTSLGQVFMGNTTITSFDELQYFISLTSIDDYAFHNCRNLIGLLSVIPSSVTRIGDYAFYGCKGFTGSLNVPISVTEIGDYAFYGCSGFTGGLNIHDAVTSIGSNAFSGCSNFETITVDTGNSFYDSREDCNALINTLTDELVFGCKNTVIPYSVFSIGSYAFYNCSGLTGSLDIPFSVILIDSYAFYNCRGLTGSLVIPYSVNSIGEYAFYNCSGFTGSLTIPDFMMNIDGYAFYGCRGLTSIIFLSYEKPYFGQHVFDNIPTDVPVFVRCGMLENFQNNWNYSLDIMEMCDSGTITVVASPSLGGMVYGAGTYESGSFCTVSAVSNNGYCFALWTENEKVVSTDPDYSFVVTGDRSLTAVFVMDGNIAFADANVKSICVTQWDVDGDGELSYAEAAVVMSLGQFFKGNTEITSFEELQYFIGLGSIGNSAFNGCSNLTGSLIIPNSVTSIGDLAFYNCSGFTGSLIIPNSVTTIGSFAFQNCSGFTGSLSIPNFVTTIGSSTFRNCSGFTGSLIIPNSVTAIYDHAFYGCSGFTGDLTIGDSVTSISISAFENCSGFTGSLTIGNSVTVMGSSAFRNCSGFTGSLNIPNSVTTINDHAFHGCSGFTGDLTIGNSVTEIGISAFQDCSGFTGNLTIGNSVTEIGISAFQDCSGFTGSLTIPNSVTIICNHAFYGCSGFTGDLTIGDSVTDIDYLAFKDCSGFTGSLTIGNSVTMIGSSAFNNCSGFTGSLTIPDFVTSIGGSAFYNCSGFSGDLYISDSVTTIGYSAFRNCNGFTGRLTIGNSVTTIESYAFGNCSNFTSMKVLPETPPTSWSAFYSSGLYGIPVYIPCGSLAAYQSAGDWRNFTNYQEDCVQTQAITLAEGWNWVSLYVEFEDAEQALQAFEAALDEHGLKISSVDDFTTYADGEWGAMGDLEEMTNDLMYMVLVDEDMVVTLSGVPSNPADYTINIYPGWTWIGFPSSEAVAVEDAFADFEAEDGDKIMSVEDYTTYAGEWGAAGDLEELVPGTGYMYFSNSTQPKTLVFSTTSKGKNVFLRKRK